MTAVKITLVANAGILLEYDRHKVLIDGIHTYNRSGYHTVDEETIRSMEEGIPPFDVISHILFSHCHQDHFCPQATLRVIKGQDPAITTIALPQQQHTDWPELYNYLNKEYSDSLFLALQKFQTQDIVIDQDISITVFQVPHMGEAYRNIENYVFLFQFGNTSILVLSDADCDGECFRAMLNGRIVDAVFVNPLVINNAANRDLLLNTIRPRNIIVYHIPDENGVNKMLRLIAEKDAVRFRPLFENALPDFGQLFLFETPMEIILLENGWICEHGHE